MRTNKKDHSTREFRIWLSARDTYEWAHKPGAWWPCSTLAGKRVYAEFDRNGNLVDIAINGRSDEDCDAHEFNAMIEDFRARADRSER